MSSCASGGAGGTGDRGRIRGESVTVPAVVEAAEAGGWKAWFDAAGRAAVIARRVATDAFEDVGFGEFVEKPLDGPDERSTRAVMALVAASTEARVPSFTWMRTRRTRWRLSGSAMARPSAAAGRGTLPMAAAMSSVWTRDRPAAAARSAAPNSAARASCASPSAQSATSWIPLCSMPGRPGRSTRDSSARPSARAGDRPEPRCTRSGATHRPQPVRFGRRPPTRVGRAMRGVRRRSPGQVSRPRRGNRRRRGRRGRRRVRA